MGKSMAGFVDGELLGLAPSVALVVSSSPPPATSLLLPAESVGERGNRQTLFHHHADPPLRASVALPVSGENDIPCLKT